MGHWGFVFLAYGIVWLAILFYVASLKRRLAKIQAELELLERSSGGPGVPSERGARG